MLEALLILSVLLMLFGKPPARRSSPGIRRGRRKGYKRPRPRRMP